MTESTEAIFQIQWQTVEQLKAFIESMKAEKQSEYLRKIRELEEELNHLKTSKKYGIVFEEKREDFEERSRNALPVLQEVVSMRLDDVGESPTNIVIEGDNYHALSCLRYTHKGKVDVIYIDPPYNTGNKDFIYNDRFVDKEDTYRHSKWLSFMKKRLVLAQELLSESGVIFMSIDDNEQAQLKMLCDEVFGEGNFVANIIIQSNPRWSQSSKHFAGVHEYLYCYAKNINFLKLLGEEKKEETINEYNLFENNWGKKIRYRLLGLRQRWWAWRREDRPNMFYPIYINPINGECSLDQTDIYSEVSLPKRPSGEESRWTWWREKVKTDLKFLIGKRVNRKGEDVFWDIFRKDFLVNDSWEEKLAKTKTIWNEKELNYQNGWSLLKEILQADIFSYPKPVDLIKRVVQIGCTKSSLILDFFAGSGTTGHAVLELNREDGGNRQFILCSNREATAEQPDKNICRDITYERVKRVATGYKNSKGESISGLGGNIRYYQTDFIQIEKSRENLKQKFMLRCNDLIMLKENTFDAVTLQNPIPWLFLYRNGERYTAVAYDYLYLDQVRDFLRSLNRRTSLYIFSISSGFIEEFEDMKDIVDVKSIPEEILEVYLRIFNL